MHMPLAIHTSKLLGLRLKALNVLATETLQLEIPQDQEPKPKEVQI